MAKTVTRDETREELLALRFKYAVLERQLAEARATIAALQWTEIKPDNVPQVGDEAYSANDGDFTYVQSFDLGTAQEWTNDGWTHRRPISPPAQASATEDHIPQGDHDYDLEDADLLREESVAGVKREG